MRKRLSTIMAIIAALSMLFITGPAMALNDTATQTTDLTVDEIAVIDVSAPNVPALNITAPATGGLDPVDDSDATTYAQYTSVVAASATRSITAQMSVAAPAGTQLTLATTVSGTGEGTSAAAQTLDVTTAIIIVTAIGSCATGTGASDGALLTYSFEMTDATALVAGEQTTPTITLTLTDAS
jgi:hypothetical protein